MQRLPEDVLNARYIYEGRPYFGNPVLVKPDDPDQMKPVPMTTGGLQVIETSNETDMQKFTVLSELVTKGWADMQIMDRQYDAGIKGWRLLIMFTLHYYEPPRPSRQNTY